MRVPVLFALILSSLPLVLGPACALTGCALTTPEKTALAAAEPTILAANAFACTEAEMIPVVGAALEALACPGEEQAVKTAIDQAIASSPDAGADAGAPTVALAAAKVTRRSGPGRCVVIGKVIGPPAADAGAADSGPGAGR